MDGNDTRRLLDQITDEGLFEELATAVLRKQDPRCRRLAHVGVNVSGRTVKSRLDGVEYISDQGSLRLMAVHHTTWVGADTQENLDRLKLSACNG